MNKHAWFVAGTDTEIGKTFVACALLHALRNRGISAIGMKPVAAGTDEQGHNDDVEALIAAAGVKAPRELVNPYLFAPAIAPHIAALEENRPIDIERIAQSFAALRPPVPTFCAPMALTARSRALRSG